MKTLTAILLTSHNITGNARKNIEALLSGVEMVRTCHTSGSGRFCSNIDSHAATIAGLNKLGLKFTQGNDAPKGGKTGQWIKLAVKIQPNGRLIAAAPELLEALRTLVQMTGNVGQIEHYLNTKAHAAIAKATI